MAGEIISGRLTDGGHELQQRVYFEDTDFSGRVYHARYLHFMERGRSDYLRLLGIHHRALAADGLAFAVRHLEIDFLEPAGIDDDLTKTIDYGRVYEIVQRVMESTTYRLLEALAEAISHEILAVFDVLEVGVRIRKPAVRLGGPLDHAAVEIWRRRQ